LIRPHDANGTDDPSAFLTPGSFVDSDHPDVIAFARKHVGDATDPREMAIRLYYAVRDEIRYDAYLPWTLDEGYRASTCLQRRRGFCIPKAALFAASCRVVGIPARVAFADVRNHLSTPRLQELMKTDLFTHHGVGEVYLDGRWLKVSPTFNIELCKRFGVKPLEFDGASDALMHPFDASGRRHMEYVEFHGSYFDVPAEQVRNAMISHYGREACEELEGDFAREGEASHQEGA